MRKQYWFGLLEEHKDHIIDMRLDRKSYRAIIAWMESEIGIKPPRYAVTDKLITWGYYKPKPAKVKRKQLCKIKRNRQLVQMRNSGEKFQAIGVKFGITRQRAWYIYHNFID